MTKNSNSNRDQSLYSSELDLSSSEEKSDYCEEIKEPKTISKNKNVFNKLVP